MISNLSAWDDYPVHQHQQPVRHVATSDRNFYDRYYFNLHSDSDELFLITGLGQYPNLGVQDAFAVVRRGTDHRVVRASRELGDRSDTSVGPFRIEVIEPLHKVRCILEDNEHGIEFDVVWEGSIPAHEEPTHFIRRNGRVVFDTSRFAQTGRWTGQLKVGDEVFDITSERWMGTRDRSWGVRPVGEPEPPGIQAKGGAVVGMAMWNYAPMQFDDFSILYICQEDRDGTRIMEEGVRIFNDPDRPVEQLGRPEHAHEFRSGTRLIERSVLSFHPPKGDPISVRVSPLLECHAGVGTGYGRESDWRHGMYQGELVVQGLHLDVERDKERFGGLLDSVARFELDDGQVGYGLHEYTFNGPNDRYGFVSTDDVAP